MISLMRYVLGFDGGGTKTECVLVSEDGRVLAKTRSGASNPTRVGFPAAMAALCEAARMAEQHAGIKAEEIAAVCAGLAGAAHPAAESKLLSLLDEEFAGKKLRVCTDLLLLLEAAGDPSAIVLVAGTGSAAFGRDDCGQVVRAGGYGPLFSDDGGAYDIGREALRHLFHEYDRTGVETPLAVRVLRECNAANLIELQQRAHRAADETLTKLFPVVAKAADDGDSSAQLLLSNAARQLAALAATVAGRLQRGARPIVLVLNGGMLGRSKFFDEALRQGIAAACPNARIGAPKKCPAEAAADLALQLLQEAPGGPDGRVGV